MALSAVERLEDKRAGYHPYLATHAELLRRLTTASRRAAYNKAIGVAGNTAEIDHLRRRRDQLG